MNGGVAVRVESNRVVGLDTAPPLAAKILAGPGGPELVVVGAAAGLLEGDTVAVDITLGPGARLVVRSTAATLAHPCPGGGATSSTVRACLGEGASLVWVPEPLVAFGGCRHRGRSALDLGPGATAVWYEALTLGRSSERAGQVDLRFDVTLEGAPLLRDGFRSDAAFSPAVLGGLRHTGSVHILGVRPPPGVAGALDLAGPGATVRAVAPDAATLERQLAPARRSFSTLLSVTGFTEPEEALVHG